MRAAFFKEHGGPEKIIWGEYKDPVLGPTDVLVKGAYAEETGLDSPVVAQMETFDGFTYQIQVGSTNSAGNYHVSVSVQGDYPRERTAGEEEAETDKEKLDTEFVRYMARLR